MKTLPKKIHYNLWHLRAYLPISMDRNYQSGNRHENGDVANELSAEECVLSSYMKCAELFYLK